MALVLPYPDMDFVPLDILTAAELNQMVANTEFIANQFPIASSQIDRGSQINNGNWALVAEKRLGENINGQSWLELSIPVAYQGGAFEYQLRGGVEFMDIASEAYPRLQPKVGSSWQAGNMWYSCVRFWNNSQASYGTTDTPGGQGTASVFGWEWYCTNYSSCTFEVNVGKAYDQAHWSASGRAGGVSGSTAGTYIGGSRISTGNDLTGFRIASATTISMAAGSSLALFARKRQGNFAL